MKPLLVWILVSMSNGGYNSGNVSYSPYLSSLEDCVRLQKAITNRNVITKCVQLNIIKETS